jgi:2-phospho-L-lactate/phosphoenolpyruvate guanylyltransferase
MALHALIPLKSFTNGKTRLAEALSATERASLIRSMFEHVVGAIEASGIAERIVLVGPEAPPPELAIEHFDDSGANLNDGLQSALDVSAAAGATRALVIHADLPELTRADVRQMASTLEDFELAIAPDRHGLGTNALALRLPVPIPFVFGTDSFARHCALAHAGGQSLAVVMRSGLANDVDTLADIRPLRIDASTTVKA